MTNSEEIENQQLEDLAWAIEASLGKFKLILANCNYLNLQNQLIQRLKKISQIEIQTLELKKSQKTLYNSIQEEFNHENQALMIVGWESLPNLSQLLISANQVREEFRNNCPYPVVFWINAQIYQQLMSYAPDLESWGITINFSLPGDDLINLINSIVEKILNQDFNIQFSEIELAFQDLQKSRVVLSPDFEANCNFLWGFVQHHYQQLETAMNYYQQSLNFWRTTDNLQVQGKILYFLTICDYEKSRYPTRPIAHPTFAKERVGEEFESYLQQTITTFENAQRLDLIANSLEKFGLILQELQAWQQLQTLAIQALEIHQAKNNILKISQDYIFLAAAALGKSNFLEAEKIANQGLNFLTSTDEQKNNHKLNLDFYRQSLLFHLAKSQQKLQQYQSAINNLKLARDIGVVDNQPKLYVDILNLLQSLFFQQKEYLEAFNTKLECRSIEQQFGLKAFIGPGSLKPRKITNVDLLSGTSPQLNSSLEKGNIPPEIAASGRQIDVDKILQRISRNDSRIIVIYGQSGVGKSSLVNAGIIPALQNKPIGIQDNLPVTIRVYNSWFTELKQQLLDLLPKRLKASELKLDTQSEFVSQLQEIADNNLRTVLIFDQFEEFFFVYPDHKVRSEFFQFLGECLNILSVKVILSLRVDYLHLLLECNELDSMKIISQDILSKNVLYKLGNLTPDNAKLTIQRLTENTDFYLDKDLIDRLVQDLAEELGAVLPIELQIVGAQLQTEEITTLAAYEQGGTKEELVQRYLDEIVNDCGLENKQVAELLLYLLTDEQGTRPQKTKAELERDLQYLSTPATQLDLVLEIFLKSGLVVFLPENPADSYQLVHDYLALFIRQQQEPLREQLEKAQAQRKIAEAKLNRFIKTGSLAAGVLLTVLTFIGGLGIIAWNAAQNAAINEIQSLIKSSKRMFNAGTTHNALIEGLNAAKKLKITTSAKSDIQILTIATLRQAIYLQRNEKPVKRALNVNTLKGHDGEVVSLKFSPDGKKLASGSSDKTIKIWDVSTGKVLNTLTGHDGDVVSLEFSPDGKKLASGSSDKTIKIWDVSTGKVLNTLTGHDGDVVSLEFSPDGKQLASGSWDKTIKIWDVSTGKVLNTIKGHESSVLSVGFSPDGKQLASGSSDKTIKIWDVSTGKVLNTIKGHESSVLSVGFSPDGKQLASGSVDKTIKIWNVSTGKLLNTLKGHESSVLSVGFSPDSKQLASGSYDNTIKIWDVRTGKLLNTLPSERYANTGHESLVISVGFSPDGKQLASGSSDNTIKIWDVRTGKLLNTLKGHESSVISVGFSPDGKQLASGSDDKTIKIWDVRTGKLLNTLKGHESLVISVGFSPDGKQLASGSVDKTIKIWDVRTGKLLNTLTGHESWVYSVGFSPDGKQLASGSVDKTIKIWDVRTGKLLNTLTGHESWVYSVGFSPDGKQLASGSSDNTIILWELSDFNLEGLITSGCDLLNNYLIGHPQVLAELEDCQKNQSRLSLAAKVLVIQGENLAYNDDINAAVAKFHTAQKWDKNLKFDPEAKAEEFAKKGQAKRWLKEGKSNVSKGKVKEAISAYSQAQKVSPQLEITASDWNELCWYGSLNKQATDVMFACEKAVNLSPDYGWYRDSRGLARALTGDYSGAIEDFQAFIKWSNDKPMIAQRQDWMKKLKAGENPFTDEVLKKLR